MEEHPPDREEVAGPNPAGEIIGKPRILSAICQNTEYYP